jgi:hypothetical protein
MHKIVEIPDIIQTDSDQKIFTYRIGFPTLSRIAQFLPLFQNQNQGVCFMKAFATLESLGLLKLILALAFFGSLTWLVFDLGWLSTDQDLLSYVVMVVIEAILAVGMAWSHIWRRLSGRVEAEEDHHHD